MFFDRLKEACDERGISMSNLLDKVGMSRGNIARWKSGLEPKPATILRLAEELGVDRSVLEPPKEKDFASKSEVTDDDIKFALFDGAHVTDEQFEEVKRFAKYVRDRGIHST